MDTNFGRTQPPVDIFESTNSPHIDMVKETLAEIKSQK